MQDRKLRILIFNDEFAPHTQTFVYNDVRYLSRYHEVMVVCTVRTNEDKFPYDQVRVIPCHRGRFGKKMWWILYKNNLSMNYHCRPFAGKLNTLLKEFKPDLVHCHFAVNGLRFLDNLSTRKIPRTIVNLHGYDVTEMVRQSKIYRRRLSRLFLHRSVFPTATSRALFDHLDRSGIPGTEKGRVIYSGIETDFFDPTKVKRTVGAFTFIQVGGFREKKGHRYTIAAFHRLLQEEGMEACRLVLIGGGELEAEIKLQCHRLGIKDQVIFAGWRTAKEVRRFLGNADVLLHHSITAENGDQESSPIAIAEAMAMELPVLASHHSGIPELIRHGVNGLLVPEKDIPAYSRSMKEIMSWGKVPRNRQKIIDNFTYQKRIEDLNDYYRYSMSKTPSGE